MGVDNPTEFVSPNDNSTEGQIKNAMQELTNLLDKDNSELIIIEQGVKHLQDLMVSFPNKEDAFYLTAISQANELATAAKERIETRREA